MIYVSKNFQIRKKLMNIRNPVSKDQVVQNVISHSIVKSSIKTTSKIVKNPESILLREILLPSLILTRKRKRSKETKMRLAK